VVDGARLESVCTPKGYLGFESLTLRTHLETFLKIIDQTKERWQSGRMYLIRNQAYPRGYRGFESHFLRKSSVSLKSGIFFVWERGNNNLSF
jgi:hypothetical protein